MTEYEPIKRTDADDPVPSWCVTHGVIHYRGADGACDLRDLYVRKGCGATFTLALPPTAGVLSAHAILECELRHDHDMHLAEHDDEGVMYTVRWATDV